MISKDKRANIAALNDAFRQQPLLKGKLLITQGVQLPGEQFVATTIVAFMEYNDFNMHSSTLRNSSIAPRAHKQPDHFNQADF